jgi:branched-chain amino acid transport system substrate-binding protein
MKKLLMAFGRDAGAGAGAASAEDVKLGILIGFTGPIESLTSHMAAAAELAMAEVNASGKAPTAGPSSGPRDDTCTDAAAATAAAERLITAEGVKGIIGGDCSGVTRAMLTNVAMPNGIVMVSPSATSPALTTDPDDGLFFRTAPSDAREGEVMADILMEKGVKSIALTYSNSDYGKGLAESIAAAFTAKGGTVTINAPMTTARPTIRPKSRRWRRRAATCWSWPATSTRAARASSRPRSTPAPSPPSACPAAWSATSLPQAIGPALDGSYGQHAAVRQPRQRGPDRNGPRPWPTPFDATSAYSPESYDAAALIMLAMQAAGSTDRKVYKDKIMEIANGPADGSGTKILPGELGKALELIAAGTAIDYDGATGVTLIGPGESAGRYREFEIKGGKYETVKYR